MHTNLLALFAALPFLVPVPQPDRPNILWITCEDISPNLGCYGDDYAVTPNLDKLASQGVLYENAFATIGVCAPARSTIITGMYPPSIGTQHMRCTGKLPKGVKLFPAYLRAAGYYCTNRSKTDYNLRAPAGTWDESSRKAHWRNRKPGQPFFSVVNFTSCHESQIRLPEKRYKRRTKDFTKAELHDPAKAHIPPYHPDTPEVRKDWARYADMITFMDKQVGKLLAELEADGLADDTIVMFYSDHGAGMPRSKRWLYDSSLRVPMIARFPEKYKQLAPGPAGSSTDRLVSFVDLAPTVLSLAGVEVPAHMQGKAFLGKQAAKPRKWIYGFRDRMDSRYDMLRCVSDGRFEYIRNYLPHVPWAQYISYMYQMPTMQVWQRLHDEGKLDSVQDRFFHTKPTEELYDTQADPHEVMNLAADPAHAERLARMRGELRAWMERIVDLGFLPEADLRTRFGNTPPFDAVRDGSHRYPFDQLMAAADLACRRDPAELPALVERFGAGDPAIRYWATVGCAALGTKARPAGKPLLGLLEDSSPDVRIGAADALCRLGNTAAALPVLRTALGDANEWARLRAINVVDSLDDRARALLPAIRGAKKDKNRYVVRVATKALQDLSR